MKVSGTFEINEAEAQAWLNTLDTLRREIEGLKEQISQLQHANTNLEAYVENLEDNLSRRVGHLEDVVQEHLEQ